MGAGWTHGRLLELIEELWHGIADDAAQLHVYKTMYEFWQRNFELGD